MRLHLVDGTYELYRAHFSHRPDHIDPEGRDRKATVGVVQSLLGLLEDRAEAPTHLAVAFDNPIVCFRNDLFAGYKTDEGVPPELRAQFDAVEEAVEALGVRVWSMDRFEADDALATAAARFGPAVDEVRLLTPDKDLGQCLRQGSVIQVDRMRKKEIDEAAMRARWGVAPGQLPALLGLTGDTADGIPGIPGFGEKTAAALLSRFGSIAGIPDDPAAWDVPVRGKDRLAATLAARRADAELYARLATLSLEAPIDDDVDALRHGGVPRERFLTWCDRVGVEGSLRSRPRRWA
jgi:5'-3' exonuclease